MGKIFSEYGVDSYVARSASVIMASNDTIFYIAAVYLSSCKDKSAGAAIAISLASSLAGAICACLLCRISKKLKAQRKFVDLILGSFQPFGNDIHGGFFIRAVG